VHAAAVPTVVADALGVRVAEPFFEHVRPVGGQGGGTEQRDVDAAPGIPSRAVLERFDALLLSLAPNAWVAS